MARFAYVNGAYLPHRQAAIQIEDRGFQFADGVYEVLLIAGGRPVDAEGHYDRLERSLAELRIPMPVARRALGLIVRELVRRNRLRDGLVYLQITRGVARRDFKFPKGSAPTLVVTARPSVLDPPAARERGSAAISVPDLRWGRRDIKTTQLLAQVLAKQTAIEAGCGEALMVDAAGFVTEGSSSNAWLVQQDGTLVTRPATHDILKGVTRTSIARLARALGHDIVERPFTVAEAQAARELFVTAASALATPIVALDGVPIGNGHPGSVTLSLREAYLAYLRDPTASPVRWHQDDPA